MELPQLIDLMLVRRVRYVRLADGVEVELDESAFVAAPADPVASSPRVNDPDRCQCGHSFMVEHGESGCLRGCLVETCTLTEARA